MPALQQRSWRGLGRLALLVLLTMTSVAAGCRAPAAAADSGAPPGAAFYSPQGIAASDRYVLVASTALHYEGGKASFGAGFVTIIDRRTREVLGRAPATQPNPQSILVVDERAFVVNGGGLRYGDSGPVTAASGGGIDVIELSEGPPFEVKATLPLGLAASDRRIGAYGSIALAPDGVTAFIGSGTRGDVFKVDLAALRVLRGPDRPIALFPTAADRNGMTVVRRHGAQLAVLDFNSDALCLSSDVAGDLAKRTCHPAGVQKDLLEGPIDVALAPGGETLVLMTLANALYRLDATRSPFRIEPGATTTGLASNRVVVHGEAAYVVNSASNNLQRVDLATGRSDLPFAILPLRSNPYDMVITREAEGDIAWITLFGSHQVAAVDLTSGKLLELLPRPSAADGADGGDGGTSRDGGAGEGGTGDGATGCADAGLQEVRGIENLLSASFGPGAGDGQDALPGAIQGGPHGGGAGAGSTNVLSLGVGGEVIVDFGEVDIVDGPGHDFIVFENPFLLGPYQPFAEPAIVGVSSGGTAATDFADFPCDLSVTEGDPAKETWPFPGCAGVRPVFAGPGQCISPADPERAGGDAFDLATIGLSRARYLRLRDAGLSTIGTSSKGFDLDAVVLINYEKR